MGNVLINLIWPRVAQKQLDAAFEANREAEAVWRELGNLPKLVETYDMRYYLHLLADEHEEQLAAASELHRLSSSTGNLMFQDNALMFKGDLHRLHGRFAASLSEFKAAEAIQDESENPFLIQATYYFVMALYLAAGAMERAENCADMLYTMEESMMPVFKSAFLTRIARVKIASGKLDQGAAILDQALELCGINNFWSHNVIDISIAEAYLQLALGRPEAAFCGLEDRVQGYRQNGFHYSLAEEYLLRGKVSLALGDTGSAQEMLQEAKVVALEKDEPIYLWQILAALCEIESMRGNETEAEKLRGQAGEIIEYIAEHAGDEEGLRAAFLAQPAVVRVLAASRVSIRN